MNNALISGEFLFQCSAKGKLLSDVKDVHLEFQQLFIEKLKKAYQCPLHLLFHCYMTQFLNNIFPLLPTVCMRPELWVHMV